MEPNFKDYVYNIKIDLDGIGLFGQYDSLDIVLFENCFGEVESNKFVPMIGVQKGTDNLCYGVKNKNNFTFKIFNRELDKVFELYIVEDIASFIAVGGDLFSGQYSVDAGHLRVEKIEKQHKIIDVNKIDILIGSYNLENPTNRVEEQMAKFFMKGEDGLLAVNYLLENMAQAIYFNVATKFLYNNKIKDAQSLSSNKLIVRMIEKSKNKRGVIDLRKNKKINKIDINQWYEIIENMKKLMPEHQVFDEIGETSMFDLLTKAIDGSNDMKIN